MRALMRAEATPTPETFRRLGFRPRGGACGARRGMASEARIRMIRGLWRDWSGADDARALDRWIARTCHVESLRFLTAGGAAKAIPGLKAMAARDGVRRRA